MYGWGLNDIDLMCGWVLKNLDVFCGWVYNVDSMLRLFYMSYSTPTKVSKARNMFHLPSWEVNTLWACYELSTIYDIQMMINMTIRLFHWTPIWASWTQSKSSHYLKIHFIYISIYVYFMYDAACLLCLQPQTSIWISDPPIFVRSFILCWLSCIFFHWTWSRITPLTLLPASRDLNNNNLRRFLGLRVNVFLYMQQTVGCCCVCNIG
jgi:hypothetical protein